VIKAMVGSGKSTMVARSGKKPELFAAGLRSDSSSSRPYMTTSMSRFCRKVVVRTMLQRTYCAPELGIVPLCDHRAPAV